MENGGLRRSLRLVERALRRQQEEEEVLARLDAPEEVNAQALGLAPIRVPPQDRQDLDIESRGTLTPMDTAFSWQGGSARNELSLLPRRCNMPLEVILRDPEPTGREQPSRASEYPVLLDWGTIVEQHVPYNPLHMAPIVNTRIDQFPQRLVTRVEPFCDVNVMPFSVFYRLFRHNLPPSLQGQPDLELNIPGFETMIARACFEATVEIGQQRVSLRFELTRTGHLIFGLPFMTAFDIFVHPNMRSVFAGSFNTLVSTTFVSRRVRYAPNDQARDNNPHP